MAAASGQKGDRAASPQHGGKEEVIRAFRKRILAAALSTASVIVFLQATVLPGIFDLVTDLMVIGLIYVVGKVSKDSGD